MFFSHSFNEVQQQSDFYWRKIQTDFLEEYSIKTIFPVHLQLLALPGIVFAMMWVIYRKCRSVVPKEEKEKKGSVVLKDNPESGPMSVVKGLMKIQIAKTNISLLHIASLSNLINEYSYYYTLGIFLLL